MGMMVSNGNVNEDIGIRMSALIKKNRKNKLLKGFTWDGGNEI